MQNFGWLAKLSVSVSMLPIRGRSWVWTLSLASHPSNSFFYLVPVFAWRGGGWFVPFASGGSTAPVIVSSVTGAWHRLWPPTPPNSQGTPTPFPFPPETIMALATSGLWEGVGQMPIIVNQNEGYVDGWRKSVDGWWKQEGNSSSAELSWTPYSHYSLFTAGDARHQPLPSTC